MNRFLARTALAAVLAVHSAFGSPHSRQPDAGRLLLDHSFQLARASEIVAVLMAGCTGCSWETPGREAAALSLWLDGRYSQHLFLVRGDRPADYRVALGALGSGAHKLTIALDPRASAPRVEGGAIEAVEIRASDEHAPDHVALSLAPILHPRPNTIGRFTDVPLLMWYETERTDAGIRFRYSVVFSNEDGGTPADRLMATWGRLTDIELVYAVELDAHGRIVGEQFQGPGHELRPFAGQREGRHPLLWVVTDNNMVSDTGTTSQRYAPAPIPFELAGVSREAVMDAHPWTYAVSAQEVTREGKISASATPGSGRVPDPRRFAYLEACGTLQDATLSFAVAVTTRPGQKRWLESDGGRPEFRIARTGCFRGAVALPEGVGPADLEAVRFRAFTRPPREGEPPLPSGAGAAHVKRVNRVFLLRADYTPDTDVIAGLEGTPLTPDGPAVELVFNRRLASVH